MLDMPLQKHECEHDAHHEGTQMRVSWPPEVWREIAGASKLKGPVGANKTSQQVSSPAIRKTLPHQIHKRR